METNTLASLLSLSTFALSLVPGQKFSAAVCHGVSSVHHPSLKETIARNHCYNCMSKIQNQCQQYKVKITPKFKCCFSSHDGRNIRSINTNRTPKGKEQGPASTLVHIQHISNSGDSSESRKHSGLSTKLGQTHSEILSTLFSRPKSRGSITWAALKLP